MEGRGEPVATKSAEQKTIEKQIKENKQHAQEAARRERAKAVVDAARYIGEFRIMNSEAETMLRTALEKITDPSKYITSVDKKEFDRNISDNFALVCEELQQYGKITAYMLAGTFAQLTLSEAGKTYFEEKTEAEIGIGKMTDTARNMVFISHRTIDASVADMIKDFLINTGIPNDKVFCSSLPGNDVNERISPEVKERLKKSTINILILSKDYYDSAYCLNEAGVAWYIDEAIAIPIGLPEISHENMIGFLNNDYKLRRLDNDDDISYLYDIAQERFNAGTVKHSIITRETKKLKERYAQYISARKIGSVKDGITQHSAQVVLEKDEGILLVFAADDSSGQVLMINSISRLGPSISTHGWEFNCDETAREAARWKGALEKLERYGLVEASSYKREVFIVTDRGYKVAEQVKEKWGIDTSKNPDEYIERDLRS